MAAGVARADAAPALPSLAPPEPAAAALAVLRRAARELPAYRAHLQRHGVDPDRLTAIGDAPVLRRADLAAAGPSGWCPGGDTSLAAEWVPTGGSTGAPVLLPAGRREVRAVGRLVDDGLAAIGVAPGEPALLVNALPGGVALPARLAAVAATGPRPDVVLAALAGPARAHRRVVLVGDPLLLKEVAEQGQATLGPGWAPPGMHVVVGGEWVAESWRTRFLALTGLDEDPDPAAGVVISMGTAEAGLNLLAETPALRAARRVLAVDPSARRDLLGRDPGYAPELLAADPRAVLVEEVPGPAGMPELALTSLRPRLAPMVRYAPGDHGQLVDPRAVAALVPDAGPVPPSVVAVWGRVGQLEGRGWSLRPEPVKEALFALPDAGRLTGRFHLEPAHGHPVVHLQFRGAASAPPRLAADLAAAISWAVGREAEVVLHACRAYPWHAAGDFQRKPAYLARP